MRQAGFSLVEAVVAAAVLATGVLALAGTASTSRGITSITRGFDRAADAAARRLALLHADPCGSAGGFEARAALSVTWTVAGAGALRQASVAVEWHDTRSPRRMEVAAALLCTAAIP
jgi:Tfp pilus assembly protein PilV